MSKALARLREACCGVAGCQKRGVVSAPQVSVLSVDVIDGYACGAIAGCVSGESAEFSSLGVVFAADGKSCCACSFSLVSRRALDEEPDYVAGVGAVAVDGGADYVVCVHALGIG
jgi:hypothetical protein